MWQSMGVKTLQARLLNYLSFCLLISTACASRSPSSVPANGPGVAAASSTPSSAAPAIPIAPPAAGAVQTNLYRNLFAERGRSEAEIRQKIDRAYESLFHGDPASHSVYYPAGENASGALAYVLDVGNDDVRSEGMSYGMMIAVQMDKQAEFRALWNWAKTYMQNRDAQSPAYGYFAWQVKRTGQHMDDMPAADGEEYFVTALYFAAARWGKGPGIYDYAGEADELLDRMKNRRDIRGLVNGKRMTTGSTLFNVKEKMVRFTPDMGGQEFTDPSYHLPAFYEIWARVGPEKDRGFWREAAAVSRDFFNEAAHPKTGLVPDYARFDGTPMAASWDSNTVRFRFDAWRTAMNWAVDYGWAADARQKELSNRMQTFFEGQGIGRYGNNFTLDGVPTSNDHSSGLVAMNAVASLSATESRAWLFVDELWQLDVPSGKWRYYDGMLYLMALLHLSGNFRAYLPA
jgi:oligosaccharide reducing-end xylanase